MNKIIINGEEIILKPFALKEGDCRTLIADAREVIKYTVNNVAELAEVVEKLSSKTWSCDLDRLTLILGGSESLFPLLYKPARKDEAWIRRLSLWEYAQLLLSTYMVNQEFFKQLFEDEYGEQSREPLEIRLKWVMLKLLEYGYCKEDVEDMNFNEILELYKDLLESDKRKREDFVHVIKLIMDTPFIKDLER